MDTPHRFRAHVEVTLFALGVMALVFVAGILVGRTGGFPYPVLRAAWAAGLDWKDNWRHYLGVRSNHAKPTKRPAGGVTIHDPALAFDGYTLVTAYRLDGYNAYLLDMDGTIVHRWDAALSRVLPDPGRVRAFGGDGNIELHGAHLYRNGDLVLDLDGAGTTKLDRCSKVLWTVARSTHHNVEPLPDGSVITPASVRRSEEHPDLPFVGPGAAGYYVDDVVLRLGPDGSVLEERSVIDMLFRRGWVSTLRSGPGSDKKINDEDPLHLNDVDVLTAELAPAFPMFEAGDLLVSLRDLNTLFVADRAGRQVKWVMTGPFLGQHDPDFLPNGHLLVYDNRIYLKEPRLGNTRLLEIDPASHRVVWSWEGVGDQSFYAPERGEQQPLPNGNILIVDPLGGRLLEIAPEAGGKTVWEWVNLIEPGYVGMVTDAQRLARDMLPWVGQPCDEPIGGGADSPHARRGT